MTDEERYAEFERLREESEQLLDPDRDAELRADLARRTAALAAEPNIRYSAPVETPREPFLSDGELARVRQLVEAGNSADYWRSVIAQATRAECSALAEVVAQHVAEALNEQREAIEAQLKAQLAELKLDLVTRMCDTLATLRKALDASDKVAIDLPNWREAKSSVN